MMKTLLIHTPENYTSVSSLTEPKLYRSPWKSMKPPILRLPYWPMPENALCGFFSDAFCHSYRNYYYQIWKCLFRSSSSGFLYSHADGYRRKLRFSELNPDYPRSCPERDPSPWCFRIAFKEFRIALLVGTGLAVINGIRILIMYRDPRLALVVSLSLTATVILSKIIGCILPLGAKPAYGSGNHGISSDHYSCGHLLYYYLLLHCHKDLCPCCVTCLFLLKINDPGTDLSRSSWLWLTTIIPILRFSVSSIRKCQIWLCVMRSSMVLISSARRNCVLCPNALAIQNLCISPPDSSAGNGSSSLPQCQVFW